MTAAVFPEADSLQKNYTVISAATASNAVLWLQMHFDLQLQSERKLGVLKIRSEQNYRKSIRSRLSQELSIYLNSEITKQ